MENTPSWMLMLIVLCIRNTEAAPLGTTEGANPHYNVKEDQVALSSEKETLLEAKNISGLRGESVTLIVASIKESEIQDIQWVKNGINFATTKPNKEVTIRDSNYNERLGASNDGSLVIQKLTMEDQGEYKADILMLNSKKYEIIYVLHISEESDSHGRSTVAGVVSILVVLLLVVAAGVAFMMWKKKTMCFKESRGAQAEVARQEPEGKSEPEKEALHMEESSPNLQKGRSMPEKEGLHMEESSQKLQNPQDEANDDDDDDDDAAYFIAPQTLEDMIDGHTPDTHPNSSICEGNESLLEHSDSNISDTKA
ncbi:uncharacterized protein RB166_013478 isoform 1-T2 [Leptodactylus fuscus]|uniref:uncharacterized protein LOC142214312 n=1 Tax=Leptodactylus fuscus TaxID=238119 RepID=UPI003F4F0543